MPKSSKPFHVFLCYLALLSFTSLGQDKNMTHTNKNPNRLINATSPYLLQHAHNPVDWYPWGEEALAKAQKEDKPIIVSIGYSACHWCHVMERESFESGAIARLMNENFICIKVDREERPDVDAIYMDAVQAMGQRGGWPLNAFLTPEAKPFFAGTYFPPQHWADILQKVTEAFKKQRKEIEESANLLQQSIATSEIKKYGLIEVAKDFEEKDLIQMFEKISKKFDTKLGGMQKAPKFPMPNIYQFLLNYAQTSGSEEALAQVELTLKAMAKGGIYDQIGGGFARYSVDSEWFAPHFEKMLYDNGQLISLYAEAYNYTKDKFYKAVVFESIEFVRRELTSEECGFYSALDADSEGEEGKFYVWQYEALEKIIPKDDFKLFTDYYQVEKGGNWEHRNNILCREKENSAFAKKHGLSVEDLEQKVEVWKNALMEVRTKRVRPSLDDKILTSWNALMLKGLVDAYRVFGEKKFLDLALSNAGFIETKLTNGNKLYRTYKDGRASLEAYLEDYALLIEAYIYLYQATFDLRWLKSAEQFAEYTLQNFYDIEEDMFFFTDAQSEKLIARKKEIFDNVIPSSNAVMAKNLHLLGILLDKDNYTEISKKMLGKMKNMLLQDIEYTANWGQLYIWKAYPTAELVIVGEDYLAFREEFEQRYLPNKVLIGSKTPSQDLPLLENRPLVNNKTSIYVCFDKACQLPVNTVREALGQL